MLAVWFLDYPIAFRDLRFLPMNRHHVAGAIFTRPYSEYGAVSMVPVCLHRLGFTSK